jgi:hypothetical protein
MAIREDTGEYSTVVSSVEEAAYLAAIGGEYGQFMRLLGAADAYRESSGLTARPSEIQFWRPLADEARRALGGAEADAVYASGAELSMEDAIAEARCALDPDGRDAP